VGFEPFETCEVGDGVLLRSERLLGVSNDGTVCEKVQDAEGGAEANGTPGGQHM
jgi:hypothetical protein